MDIGEKARQASGALTKMSSLLLKGEFVLVIKFVTYGAFGWYCLNGSVSYGPNRASSHGL
jgi:hypothetical protein